MVQAGEGKGQDRVGLLPQLAGPAPKLGDQTSKAGPAHRRTEVNASKSKPEHFRLKTHGVHLGRIQSMQGQHNTGTRAGWSLQLLLQRERLQSPHKVPKESNGIHRPLRITITMKPRTEGTSLI